jgi:hypothetical protein
MRRWMGQVRPRRNGTRSSSGRPDSISVKAALMRGMVASGGNIVKLTTIASGDGL